MHGLALVLARRQVHPDAITLAGLASGLLAGGLFILAGVTNGWLLLLVPPLLFVRIACNALDGMVARQRNLMRQQGALLNEVSDRLADLACFTGLAFSGQLTPTLGAALLVALLAVSYLGVLGQSLGGSRRYDGPLGKADRMLALGLYAVAAPLAWQAGLAPQILGNAVGLLLLAGLLWTAGVRLRRSWRELDERRKI
ncbi:MAG: CDP-alcohol phosphatidyltransferase family protein [Chloroflexaceae bacterium]|nr:CDP-alcohol phosphatidyltransferase family protein [Chloroflexaceae bacterium]